MKKTKFNLAFLICLFFCGPSWAQLDNDKFAPDPPPAPINDYILFLLIAGVLFAGFLFYKSNRISFKSEN